MSDPKQSGSPSQPLKGKGVPRSKKQRQKRQGKGQKGGAKERLAPISKYLVKEEPSLQPHTPPTTSNPLENGSKSAPTVGELEGSEGVTGQPEPKSPKTEVRESEGRQRGRDGSKKGDIGISRVVRSRESKKGEGRVGEGGIGEVGGGVKTERAPQSSSGSGGRKGRTEPKRSSSTPVVRRQVQSSIRDHFPVRRSGRKTKSEIEKEDFERMAQRLRNKDESGLKVVKVESKGLGVVSTRPFSRGELVCEYSGELISLEEAQRREEEYGGDSSIGCYMYYFSHRDRKLCVDATADNGRKGRLLNHSRAAANVSTRLVEVDQQPYLCLVATRDVSVGEQLEYDYGERDRAAMDSHPWLAT